MEPLAGAIPIPEGSVVITPKQQYDEIRLLTKAVESLGNKVDNINPAMLTLRGDIDKNALAIEAIKSELSGLQKWRYMLTGATSILILLMGWNLINFAGLGG